MRGWADEVLLRGTVTVGPYEGVTAIGAGNNMKTRKRVVDIALAVMAIAHSRCEERPVPLVDHRGNPWPPLLGQLVKFALAAMKGQPIEGAADATEERSPRGGRWRRPAPSESVCQAPHGDRVDQPPGVGQSPGGPAASHGSRVGHRLCVDQGSTLPEQRGRGAQWAPPMSLEQSWNSRSGRWRRQPPSFRARLRGIRERGPVVDQSSHGSRVGHRPRVTKGWTRTHPDGSRSPRPRRKRGMLLRRCSHPAAKDRAAAKNRATKFLKRVQRHRVSSPSLRGR